ncbi:hypothetical protein [Pandoravirus japonicus]|uniref:Uncharacterized protein n=1 Tax=Pandoravirus japonicus TaxID=2823154 RepID=A0A811BN31_9VIRU|nr:hypothetical protein [Pandoravirus japonicus]
MGGHRRWRFWRRALGVALCWRRDDYEPCEGDDASRAASRSDVPDSPRTVDSVASDDAGSALVSDGIDAGNDDGTRTRRKHDRHWSSGDGICWPSAMLGRLAAMEQPIAVRCPGDDDVVYRVDLGEETLECLRGGGRRRSWSLTFFMDRERTDDRRVTLYGLMAPERAAWTVAFVADDDDDSGIKGCRAHVHIEPDDAAQAFD